MEETKTPNSKEFENFRKLTKRLVNLAALEQQAKLAGLGGWRPSQQYRITARLNRHAVSPEKHRYH